ARRPCAPERPDPDRRRRPTARRRGRPPRQPYSPGRRRGDGPRRDRAGDPGGRPGRPRPAPRLQRQPHPPDQLRRVADDDRCPADRDPDPRRDPGGLPRRGLGRRRPAR
ncbi:MAG: hypothetical protein AVDCRST_MAG19-2634, partial [uncultured Thermomicrobiales bacterium]